MTKTRVLAALVMGPAAIAAVLLLPTPWMAALTAAIFLVGLWEWLHLAGIDDTIPRGLLLIANLLLMVTLVWASGSDSGGSLVLLQIMSVIGVGWWLLVMLWLRKPHFGGEGARYGRILKLAAATLSIVPAWCALAFLHAEQPNGHYWLLLALAVVWAADSGAYFAGRRFGKHKLSPRISPNKTVEGLVGGVIAAMLVALISAPFIGTPLAQLPAVALVAAWTILFSVVGDLFESLLKRQAGAKDSGHLIPGHGGVLDRIDSVLAALPVFAFGKSLFGF
jgi:phosphatidate cytidylyltransferase